MPTVREFIRRAYRLVSASNPTIPLHGDDLSVGVEILNELLNFYAANGLLLPIATTTQVTIAIGQEEVTVGPASFLPVPNITLGRLANLEDAWIELTGVTYPLIEKVRDEFLASFKYDPLQGLPRFIIPFYETKIARLRIYPSPSQQFEFFLRGKFQLTDVGPNDSMDILPDYHLRFLRYAVAKDISMDKGRADAWTPKLESILVEARDVIEASSEVNLTITGNRASLLNGAWRVRAGI